ncbi:MAG: peptide deformylase [Oscillospiraceae bacterium]|nr:peptide deformylase [Oscillospiraceae bacterium]
MALRNILTVGDPTLTKRCRPYTDFGPRLHELLDDMRETLIEADGVGLAAPQVGILRRAVVVMETNHAEDEEDFFLELINPEIIATEGEQTGTEGCLSLPDQCGIVTRPMVVTVRAQDRNGETFEYTGEGLTARCFCHELDHLDGILYPERASKMLTDEELAEMAGDEEEE